MKQKKLKIASKANVCLLLYLKHFVYTLSLVYNKQKLQKENAKRYREEEEMEQAKLEQYDAQVASFLFAFP